MKRKISAERHCLDELPFGTEKKWKKFFQTKSFSEQFASSLALEATRERDPEVRTGNSNESCIKITLKHDVLHLTARMEMMLFNVLATDRLYLFYHHNFLSPLFMGFNCI